MTFSAPAEPGQPGHSQHRQPGPGRRPGEGEPPDRPGAGDTGPWGGADLGLLSPVRAGTRVEEVTGDAAYVRAMLEAERALARALARARVAPEAAADSVTACARPELFNVSDLARRARADGNPVSALVADLAAAVRDRDPEAARWVHHGATSQDILDTATMLVIVRSADILLADLGRAADAAAGHAARHRDTAMVGRTLTQHAVPTTFGRVAAGWLAGLLDAAERLRNLRPRLPAQLGGAAGTLAPLGAAGVEVLEAFADECGLACPELPWHTVRTPVADTAGTLAHAAGACGKVATDIASLARTEIGEVAEPTGGGSSAMPHKRNPVRAALVRSAAGQMPALAGTLYGALPAEHERPAGAWHAEWQPMRESLRLTGGAVATTAELLEGLRVHSARMRQNLAGTGGLVTAERLVAALAPHLGREEAQQRVRELSLHATDRGRELYDVLAEDSDVVGALGTEQLAELCDPAGYTGAAGAFTDRVLARHRRTHNAAVTGETT